MKKEDKIILSMLLGALIGLLIAVCIEQKSKFEGMTWKPGKLTLSKYEAIDTIPDSCVYPLHSKLKR